MEEKKFICVSCPKGCELTVSLEAGKIIKIAGNGCKRGLEYAKTEIEDPRRMLTTTVKVTGSYDRLLPVRSRSPLPKPLLLACMKEINRVGLQAPVKIGSVVIADILHTGVDMIATKTVRPLYF